MDNKIRLGQACGTILKPGPCDSFTLPNSRSTSSQPAACCAAVAAARRRSGLDCSRLGARGTVVCKSAESVSNVPPRGLDRNSASRILGQGSPSSAFMSTRRTPSVARCPYSRPPVPLPHTQASCTWQLTSVLTRTALTVWIRCAVRGT